MYPVFCFLFKQHLQLCFHWASLAMVSCLLFLRQTLTLTFYMIYCFTLLATKTTKRGVHGLVPVELNIACFQCLFLGCKNQFCSFNFQVTFPIALPGLIFVNCLRHFPCKLTMHFFSFHLFKAAFCLSSLNSFFSLAPSLFKIFVFLSLLPSISPSKS